MITRMNVRGHPNLQFPVSKQTLIPNSLKLTPSHNLIQTWFKISSKALHKITSVYLGKKPRLRVLCLLKHILHNWHRSATRTGRKPRLRVLCLLNAFYIAGADLPRVLAEAGRALLQVLPCRPAVHFLVEAGARHFPQFCGWVTQLMLMDYFDDPKFRMV